VGSIALNEPRARLDLKRPAAAGNDTAHVTGIRCNARNTRSSGTSAPRRDPHHPMPVATDHRKSQ
jgi:hypothetical protein